MAMRDRVLDALSCRVEPAAMLVDPERQGGVQRCQRGYFNEPPTRERVEQLLQFYGTARRP